MMIHVMKGRAPEIFCGKSFGVLKVGSRARKFEQFVCHIFEFLDVVGFRSFIDLPFPGIVPIPAAVFLNQSVIPGSLSWTDFIGFWSNSGAGILLEF